MGSPRKVRLGVFRSTEWERVRAFFTEIAAKAQPEGGFFAILEVCGMNTWLLDILSQFGCREIVVIQPTERSKQKTDRRDAGDLAHTLWVHRQQFLDGKQPLGLWRVQPPTPQEADDRKLTTDTGHEKPEAEKLFEIVKDAKKPEAAPAATKP
jgi:hypothetical protein